MSDDSGAGGGSVWTRASRLVDEAMGMPPERRRAWLRERCGDEPGFLAYAERLLRAAEASPAASGATANTKPPAMPAGLAVLEPGTFVGPYVIREHVDRGTFGDVYIAESTDASRQLVALKVIRAGMHTAGVLARFEQEQRALGMMSHSGIARVFGACVTDDGRPCFAMELIRGAYLTRHCDAQRLGLEDRIRLVIQACEAIQHAHQKGIIHRDLKPANILVAYEGSATIAKIIDFGIAKALSRPLSARELLTERNEPLGTPAYMAPEQAEGGGQDIDTRADVYSLGAVLYELLTGALPLDLSLCTLDEMRRRIREQEPVTPSRRVAALLRDEAARATAIARERGMTPKALASRLSGDLDWIVMRCLEKERSRRYGGVDRLADDLRRYLAFEPVEAQRPSAAYRARKFVRRHRAAVASAAMVAVILAGSLVAVTAASVRNVQLQREHDRAEAARLTERGRLLLHSVANELRVDVDGRTFAPGDDSGAFDECRATLARAAELDPGALEPHLLRVQSFVFSDDREAAVEAAREIASRFPASAQARTLLASLEGFPLSGTTRAAAERPEQAFYCAALACPDPHAATALLDVARRLGYWSLDSQLLLVVRQGEAGAYEPLLGETTALMRARPELALSWALHGQALYDGGRYDDAVLALSKALELGADSWRTYYDRALCRLGLGRPREVLADLDRAAALSAGNKWVAALRGEAHLTLEEYEPALASYDEAVRLGENAPWTLQGRGEALRGLNRPLEAIPAFDAALAETSPDRTRFRARVLRSRGAAHLAAGHLDEAIADLEAARDLSPRVTWVHETLGRAYLRAGRFTEAVRSYDAALLLQPGGSAEYERALAVWFGGNPDAARPILERWASRPDYHWIHLWVWDLEMSRGHRPRAETALRAAAAARPPDDPAFGSVIDVLEGRAGESDVAWDGFGAAERLYSFYILGARAAAEGRRDEAVTWYERALALGLADEVEADIVAHHLAALRGSGG